MKPSTAVLGPRHKVTTLELFFDLVLVYALNRVAYTVADDPSALGFVRTFFLLALIWWAWVSFSWLGSMVNLQSRWVVLGFLLSMGCIYGIASGMSYWFSGTYVAVILACLYLVTRLIGLGILYAARHEADAVRRAVPRVCASLVAVAVCLLVGAVIGGSVQVILLMAAVTIEFVTARVGRGGVWPVDIHHLSERYGLIVMVAIGEGLLALGIRTTELPLSWDLALYLALAVLIDCLLWSAYFRVLAPQLRAAIARKPPDLRAKPARDVYSYLHLLLVVGLILVSVIRVEGGQGVTKNGLYDLPGRVGIAIVGFEWALIVAGFILMRWRLSLPIPIRYWLALGVAALDLIFGSGIPYIPRIFLSVGVCLLLAFKSKVDLQPDEVRQAQAAT